MTRITPERLRNAPQSGYGRYESVHVVNVGSLAVSHTRRAAFVALAFLVLLAAPASALARSFTGSISVGPLAPAGTYDAITATAQVSITETCETAYDSPDYEYCGYFPTVWTVPASQPCAPYGGGWVGPVYGHDDAPGTKTLTATWQEFPILYSGAKKACLYVDSTLVAETTYTVPAPPAPPQPPAPVSTPAIPDAGGYLTKSDARYYARRVIRKRTHRRPRVLSYECTRITSDMFACEPTWYDARNVFSGGLTLADNGETITYSFRGLRASRRCLARHRVRACARPVRWGVPPSTSPSPIPYFPPTTRNFGSGSGRVGLCRDGTLSDSIGRQGACSWHGGVA
jgi:hypothetical protein